MHGNCNAHSDLDSDSAFNEVILLIIVILFLTKTAYPSLETVLKLILMFQLVEHYV